MEKSKAQILGEQSFDSMLDPNGSYTQYGLTKREYFAGLAMSGYVVQRHAQEHLDKVKIAKWSVEIAECLLEELSKLK